MFLGRDEEYEFVKYCIDRRRNLLIVGEKGIGKTALLKRIRKDYTSCYISHPSLKGILQELIDFFGIQTDRSPRYMRVSELIDLIKEEIEKEKPLLLLDEAGNLRKSHVRLLEKLDRFGVTIIGAAREYSKYNFKEEIELNSLNKEETVEMARKLLGSKGNQVVYDLTYVKSKGKPGRIKDICDDYKSAISNLDVSPSDENTIYEFFSNVKPEIPQRINLLPLWLLFCLGFLMLIVRYFLYSRGDYSQGYAVASFGYVSLIIYRFIQSSRYS